MLRRDLHPLPFLAACRGYSIQTFRLDLVSGLTVAIFAVPQAMAYALLAGVPAVHGLYAAVVMSIVAALWGSSNFVNTGPTNSAALITGAAMLQLQVTGAEMLPMLFDFTILVGLIRLIAGLLRFGRFIRYVPEPAFLGFMAGAGILIALGQLHHLLNVPASDKPLFILRLAEVLGRAGDTLPLSLAIGLGTFVLMLVFKGQARRFPVTLIIIVVATAIALLFGGETGLILVRDIRPIPPGLPGFAMPGLDIVPIFDMLPLAFALAGIGMIEAVSIGHSLAIKRGEDLNFDQEFVGQGISQIVSGFFQGIPGSGSFSRSTLIERSGGVTRFSNVYFGIFTALALVLIPSWLNLIPVSALAGLLLYIAWEMMDLRAVRRVFDTSRSDSLVMLTTLAVTVGIKIEYGIFAGIALGAFIFFQRNQQLRIAEVFPDGQGGFAERQVDPLHGEREDLVALAVSGDLFYGVAHQLRDHLNHMAQTRQARFMVLRVRGAYSIDFSCWNAIFDFAESFHRKGGKLYLCGVRPDYERIIRDANMEAVLPPEQVFAQDVSVFRAFDKCMAVVLNSIPDDAELPEDWQRFLEEGEQRPAHADTTARNSAFRAPG